MLDVHLSAVGLSAELLFGLQRQVSNIDDVRIVVAEINRTEVLLVGLLVQPGHIVLVYPFAGGSVLHRTVEPVLGVGLLGGNVKPLLLFEGGSLDPSRWSAAHL